MSEGQMYQRRWFRFSLGTMFVVVTVSCVFLGWEMNWIHRRRAAAERFRAQAWLLAEGKERDVPFWRRFLGDKTVEWIILPETAPLEDYASAKELFPEALVYRKGETALMPSRR